MDRVYWESKDGKYAGVIINGHNGPTLLLDKESRFLLVKENNRRLRNEN